MLGVDYSPRHPTMTKARRSFQRERKPRKAASYSERSKAADSSPIERQPSVDLDRAKSMAETPSAAIIPPPRPQHQHPLPNLLKNNHPRKNQASLHPYSGRRNLNPNQKTNNPNPKNRLLLLPNPTRKIDLSINGMVLVDGPIREMH